MPEHETKSSLDKAREEILEQEDRNLYRTLDKARLTPKYAARLMVFEAGLQKIVTEASDKVLELMLALQEAEKREKHGDDL